MCEITSKLKALLTKMREEGMVDIKPMMTPPSDDTTTPSVEREFYYGLLNKEKGISVNLNEVSMNSSELLSALYPAS